MGLFSIFKTKKSIYFPGCKLYFHHKENFELYKKIFSKLDIDFKVTEKKICCGLPAFEAGYDAEARKLARRNFEIFKEENMQNIITTSPCCYKMLIIDYPKFLPDWNIKIENIWKIILEKLETEPKLIKNPSVGRVVFNDSCYLGRYNNIYDEPRKILSLIGYEVVEMYNSREECICCGNCGGLERSNSLLSDEIAKDKILQARRTGAKLIVTSSIDEYELLKKNSDNEIEVMEFSDILAIALGLKTLEKNTVNEKAVEKIIADAENSDYKEGDED